DPLPAESLTDALTVLRGLGAIDEHGRATAEGRALARIPTDPRLARALLSGGALVGARLAAEVVALLSGDQRVADADVAAAVRGLRNGHGPDARRWARDAERLERLAPEGTVRGTLDDVGLVIA